VQVELKPHKYQEKYKHRAEWSAVAKLRVKQNATIAESKTVKA